MLHKAWNSKGEMPYCFPRSSIKFRGHTVQNITDFDPNWAFPVYRPVAAFKSLRFALFVQKIYHHGILIRIYYIWPNHDAASVSAKSIYLWSHQNKYYEIRRWQIKFPACHFSMPVWSLVMSLLQGVHTTVWSIPQSLPWLYQTELVINIWCIAVQSRMYWYNLMFSFHMFYIHTFVLKMDWYLGGTTLLNGW